MGEAYDRTGSFLGAAEAQTKSEVLKQLEKDHPNLHEVRIRNMESAGCDAPARATAGQTTGSAVSMRENLDYRIGRQIQRLREQSKASAPLYYQAGQLEAFLGCLPRALDPAAAEGLNILLNMAGL